MIPVLLTIATLAQWFLAPLQLFNGVVFLLYVCIFMTIALRQWVRLLYSLLLTAVLLLFGASSLVLVVASIGAGVITLGIFARYVDVGQTMLRTVTLCGVWSIWVVVVLMNYAMPSISTYLATIIVHALFILVWSVMSSKELT